MVFALLGCGNVSQAQAPYPVPSGMTDWWPANGNGNDIIGGETVTAESGANYGTGVVGQAFNFGGGNWFQANPSPYWSLNTIFTLEMWVNFGSVSGNQAFMGAANGIGGYPKWLFGFDISGNGGLTFCTGTGANFVSAPTWTPLLNTWYHIALTRNNNTWTFYTNGIIMSVVNSSTSIPSISGSLEIGAGNSNGAFGFDGLVDEASIYNTCLTSNQIDGIYQAGSAGKCIVIIQSQGSAVNSIQIQPTGTLNLSASFINIAGTYQWYKNSSPISGATTTNFSISSIALGDAGNYTFSVTTNSTTVTSTAVDVSVNYSYIITSGMMTSWWNGNGNANDILNNNNGTSQGGVSYVGGEVGQAFSFDGSSGFISTANAINNPQNYSFEMWFKTTTGSGGVLFGFNQNQTGGGGTNSDRFLWMDNSGYLIYGEYAGGQQTAKSTATYNDGNWHHVAVVSVQGTGFYLYVDGSQVADYLSGSSGGASYAGYWRIGEDTCSWTDAPSSAYFYGLIDEVSLYSGSLTSTQIAGIYQAGQVGKGLISINYRGSPATSITIPNSFSANIGASFINCFGTYQWGFNGNPLSTATNISGVTSTNLAISYMTPNNAGTYTFSLTINGVTSVTPNLTVSSISLSAINPSGMLGWWQGESNILDSMFNDNGSFVGAGIGYAPGVSGLAFQFTNNNAGSYIAIPNNSMFNFSGSGPMTVEMWVNFDNGNGGNGLVFMGMDAGNGQNNKWLFTYGFGGAGHLGIYYNNGGSAGDIFLENAVDFYPTPGVWTHLAFTRTNNTYLLYTNGVICAADTSSASLYYSIGSALTIGGCTENLGFMQGSMDEVSIYDTCLSSNQINAIYQAGEYYVGKSVIPTNNYSAPTNFGVALNSTVNFGSLVGGNYPIGYQWYFNNNPIVNATNTFLTVANIQRSNLGKYYLVSSNNIGINTSSVTAFQLTSPYYIGGNTNIISWWTGNNTTNDAMGLNNGAFFGATNYYNGFVGTALAFNGYSSGLYVADSSSLNAVGTSFSLECWAKATWSGQYGRITGKGSAAYEINQGPGQTNTLEFASSMGTVVGSHVFPDNNWHHLCITYNGSLMCLYFDGLLEGSKTTTGSPLEDGNPFFIGGSAVGSFGGIAGAVNAETLYNIPLTAQQVYGIYAAGTSGKTTNNAPNLTGYYLLLGN